MGFAAEPGALLRFERDYPGGRVLFLEKNYRSTQTIVTAADGFIRQNHNRRDKHMTAARGPGPALEELWVYDRAAQYAYLARLARDAHRRPLFYTETESALPVLDLLDRQGIACRCRQMDGTFFTHRVVRDMADFTFAVNPADGACFLRMYYKLRAGITRAPRNGRFRRSWRGRACWMCCPSVPACPSGAGANAGPSPSTLPGCGRSGDWLDRLRHAMGYGEYLKERAAIWVSWIF
ncbi:MAG: 3'-5' exonuclease [Evtepia gabavorous]